MGKNTTDEMIREIYALAIRTHARVEEMHEDVSELKAGMELVKNVLDRQSGMLDDDEAERIALSKQVDRHEDWISCAAPNVNVRYSQS